jgi:hypothetical protein
MLEPGFDGLTHGVEQLIDEIVLFLGELVQHEIGEVFESCWGWAHSDAKPGIVLTLECPFDALEAVVSPGGAGSAHAKPADGKRNVVNHHEEIATGIEVRQDPERRDGRPTPVHIRLGLENTNGDGLPVSLGLPRLICPAEWWKSPTGHEVIGETEPGVVPGIGVLRAGVPQPHDRMQG